MAYRDDRHWPDVYFGRPGALVALPYPRGDISAPYERPVFDFVTGAGTHRINKLSKGSRENTLTWLNLGLDTYAILEAYDRGHMGIGPWAYIDPTRVNLLTANQSSGMSKRNDNVGFFLPNSTHGTVAPNAVAANILRPRAPRNIQWSFPTAPTTFPVLIFDTPYSGWYGWPCVPNKPMTFSAWAKPDGVVDTSISVDVKIQWKDAAGGTISESSFSGAALTTWTQQSVTGTPPAGAYYASPRMVASGSSITVGGSLFIDMPQLEFDSAPSAWVPGTGLNPVEIVSLSEDIPFAATWRKQPTLVLREVS